MRPTLRLALARGHQPERRRVGDRDHVRLLDRVEAGDRRAVEAHPVVERALDLVERDREALQVPLDVGEPEEQVVDALLLDLLEDVLPRRRIRRRPGPCSRSSPSSRPPLVESCPTLTPARPQKAARTAASRLTPQRGRGYNPSRCRPHGRPEATRPRALLPSGSALGPLFVGRREVTKDDASSNESAKRRGG